MTLDFFYRLYDEVARQVFSTMIALGFTVVIPLWIDVSLFEGYIF